MPKVSPEYLESRRDAILDAAESVIARVGMQRATLSTIRREARVSSGALYHYFKSKNDIVAGIRERSMALDEETYGAALAGDSARQALAGLVEAGLALNHDSPSNRDARLAAILWAEALTNDRALDTQLRLMDPWWRTVDELVRRAVDEGALDPHVDSEALAALLAALSLGATVLEAWEPGRVSVERLVGTARQLLNGGLWTSSPVDSA